MKTIARKPLFTGLGALLAAIGSIALATSSCGTTPTNVPVRTFQNAQRMDVVCMKVLDGVSGNQIPPVPTLEGQCAPVPENIIGSTLPYHLYALVTQTATGELAVVDLTSAVVVDNDRSTPGINFIPVGANPTDVGVAPDGLMSFVPAAETNKPAIYAIANVNILGDSQGLPAAESPPAPKLPLYPSCALPQAPGRMGILPLALHGVADAGADDAAVTDGGIAPAAQAAASAYDIAVVLPGNGSDVSAKVIVVDPVPFLRGAGLDTSPGDTIAPGSLAPCPILAAIELSGSRPAKIPTGPTWDDGVKYVDGGVDATPPLLGGSCSTTTTDGGATTSAADAGADADVDANLPGNAVVTVATNNPPHATAAAIDGTTFYIADDALPIIHVIDLSNPLAPREFAPLLVTSTTKPSTQVFAHDIAVSPPTSEFKRFLYAVDSSDGSVMIYDITDPATSPRVPLSRPHAELNPLVPSDRLAFAAPAAAVSFVRHDFVLQKVGQVSLGAAKSGLICNPNPNVGTSSALSDSTSYSASDPPSDEVLGAYYRSDITDAPTNASIPPGPARLRGIFAFVTLTNGQVVAIDVDDWDAPCRRPDPMDVMKNQASAIAPPEPAAASPSDDNPYHVPLAYTGQGTSPVSLEEFFPVSAPHRSRSYNFLTNDPTLGLHVPALVGVPQLYDGNTPLPFVGPSGAANPILLPTRTVYADPTYTTDPTTPDPTARTQTDVPTDPALSLPPDPTAMNPVASPNVRFSWEDPTVQIDQNWSVDFEGIIPGYEGFSGAFTSTDGYQTLTVTPQATLCRRGVEDFRLGQQRAAQFTAAAAAAGVPVPVGLDQRLADYIQIIDEVLLPTDPYWTEDNSCWDPALSSPADRYNTCFNQFGYSVDESLQRDFPILEAYDDHFVVGRYSYPDATMQTTESRLVTKGDPSNVAFLKQMQCCFHNQATFHVRTGGMWSAVGSVTGFFNRVRPDTTTNACVLSCDPRDALLSGRAVGIPRPSTLASSSVTIPDRDSILALRNPMFSFLIWNGVVNGADTFPERDTVWKFTTRGEFVPLSVNIAATTTSVAPQSMRFIDSLGDLAVVDGSGEGLVIIDIDTVTQLESFF